MKTRTTKLIVGITLALLILSGSTWIITTNQANNASSNSKAAPVEPIKRQRTEISYTAKAGMSALDQLKSEADNVVVKDSDYGQYVDSIEGHVGGSDGKYWSFYVDGTMSNIGAADYKQLGGEVITWKFQKL